MKQTARLRLALLYAAAITAAVPVAADDPPQVIPPDVVSPAPVQAGGERRPPGVDESETAVRRPYPFRGTIEKVDVEKRNVQLEGRRMPRLIHVLDHARLERDGMPIEFKLLKPGMYVTGSVRRSDDGREEAVLIRIAKRPAGEREPGRDGAVTRTPREDGAASAPLDEPN